MARQPTSTSRTGKKGRHGKPAVKLTRFSVPEQLPGATAFSDEGYLASPLQLVMFVKSCSLIWWRLTKSTTVIKSSGPARQPGSWALLYLAFTASRIPDFEPWYNTVLADQPALWRACGFERCPAYPTVWERFVELEQFADAFHQAAAAVIQHCRRKDARVGAWLHFDATEAETHATTVHDCRPGEGCPSHRSRIGSIDSRTARDIREAKDALAPDDTDTEVTVSGITSQQIERKVWDAARGGWRLRLGGHWWFSRDPDAGTRAYSKGKRTTRVWHGYLNDKAICHFTGGRIAAIVFPADESEAKHYPELLDKACEAIGDNPLAVGGDRGLSVKSVFRHNTLLGIASCFPYRRTNGAAPLKPAAGPRWDSHGVPTCRGCGGQTEFVRFSADGTRARLWYRCTLPIGNACSGDKSISCAHDWTRLLPVWRTTEAYAAMREAHYPLEHVHSHARIRHLDSPDTLTNRPKRVSIAGQQLRTNASILIEWINIARLQGWLGNRGRHTEPRQHRHRGMHAAITAKRARAAAAAPVPAGNSPP